MEACWSFSAQEEGSSLVLPDGRCDIILCYNTNNSDSPVPVVTGPATKPYTVKFEAGDCWLGIRLRPQYGIVLWRQRLAEAEDMVLSGEDAVTLLPELAALKADGLTLDSFVESMDIRGPALVDSRLCSALERLHLSGGRMRIDKLARLAGCTTRQLNRVFRINTGLTTKTYSQLVQFHCTLKLIQAEELSIADAAFEGGYSDHAHLTRAFKRFGGFAPSSVPHDLSLPALFG